MNVAHIGNKMCQDNCDQLGRQQMTWKKVVSKDLQILDINVVLVSNTAKRQKMIHTFGSNKIMIQALLILCNLRGRNISIEPKCVHCTSYYYGRNFVILVIQQVSRSPTHKLL